MGSSAKGASSNIGMNPQGFVQPGSSAGSDWMGKTSYLGNISNLTPEQQGFLSQLMTQPQDMDAFTKSIVEPTSKVFSEQLVPGIQERFEGMGEGASSSSALNQALANAAQEVATTGIAPQYMQFLQQGIANKLTGLGANAFTPWMHEQAGLAGPTIGAAGNVLSSLLRMGR